jgi:hypothetical protein
MSEHAIIGTLAEADKDSIESAKLYLRVYVYTDVNIWGLVWESGSFPLSLSTDSPCHVRSAYKVLSFIYVFPHPLHW